MCKTMTFKSVNLAEKLAKVFEQWSPKIIAEMNDHQIKLARFQGEFVWHAHAATDELFMVLDGSMTVHFRDGDVTIHAGELFVVPSGVEHKTSAESECKVLIVEKSGTVNTGDTRGELTSAATWI
jgi:mannose-6-phosphate isomerase-like protein (cupin superfamily)